MAGDHGLGRVLLWVGEGGLWAWSGETHTYKGQVDEHSWGAVALWVALICDDWWGHWHWGSVIQGRMVLPGVECRGARLRPQVGRKMDRLVGRKLDGLTEMPAAWVGGPVGGGDSCGVVAVASPGYFTTTL